LETETGIWKRVIKKKKDIVSREIAGETILVPLRGNLTDLQRIWSLNPVAAYIYKNLDGQKSLEDIRNEILSIFDVQKEDADSDIQEFISELLRSDLVEE